MKRTFVMILVITAAGVLFAGLVYAVLVAARVADPGETVQGLTARRLWATSAAMLALASVAMGGFGLARRASRAATSSGGMITLALGLVALINGALNLAVAEGGPGTGNGVVGGAAAVVLGLTAALLGGVNLARGRGAGSVSVRRLGSRA